MCGRFTLISQIQLLQRILRLNRTPEWSPRYNIAPAQDIPVVRELPDSGERECMLMRWGLVPSWAKDLSLGAKMINARAETLFEKPAFRQAIHSRRCLIPADGFYEWKMEGRAKQPYYIRMEDEQPFLLAGLWEKWIGGDAPLYSCTIITTGANDRLRGLHERMPVIVDPNRADTWLDPQLHDRRELETLLQPYPAEAFVFYPVSTQVNRVGNDSPECIHPFSPPGELLL